VSSQHKLIAGTVVVAVLAGGGAALAAIELSNSSSPAATTSIPSGTYGKGIGRYGLGQGRLGGRGLGGGLGPGADAGRFDDGGPGFAGPRMLGQGLVAAAGYLGLSTNALRTQLASGQTLAQIAEAQGKTVDGLVATMVTASRKALETAVGNGYLTQQQAAFIEANMAARLKAFVNGTRGRGPFGGGSGSFGGGTTTTTSAARPALRRYRLQSVPTGSQPA
jgi:hypothetical protein